MTNLKELYKTSKCIRCVKSECNYFNIGDVYTIFNGVCNLYLIDNTGKYVDQDNFDTCGSVYNSLGFKPVRTEPIKIIQSDEHKPVRIPFDIKKAMTDPVITRDGEDVRIICTDLADPKYPVAVEINKRVKTCTTDGEFILYDVSEFDLFMKPKPTIKQSGWINIIAPRSTAYIYKTKLNALNNKVDKELDTVKIEWEE